VTTDPAVVAVVGVTASPGPTPSTSTPKSVATTVAPSISSLNVTSIVVVEVVMAEFIVGATPSVEACTILPAKMFPDISLTS